MAVVRITKELKGDIINASMAKFRPSIEAAQDSKPDDVWGDYIYDKVWGPYRERMEALPKEFFSYKEAIIIRRVGAVDMSFIATFSQPYPIATLADSHLIDKAWGESYILKAAFEWQDLMLAADAWRERCDRALARRTAFIDGVNSVLDTFTTLAPALKAWPPLWELVPGRVKTQHKEIKERAKSDKPSIDTAKLGAMTGALTAIKLGGM